MFSFFRRKHVSVEPAKQPVGTDDLLKYFNSANSHERSVIALLVYKMRISIRVAIGMFVIAVISSMSAFYEIRLKEAPQPILMTVDSKGVVDHVTAIKDFDRTYRNLATNSFIWQWVKCREEYHQSRHQIQFKTCKYFAEAGPTLDSLVKDFKYDNPEGMYATHGGEEGTGYIKLEFLYMQPTVLSDPKAKTKMMSVHYVQEEKSLAQPEPKKVRKVATIEYYFAEDAKQGEEANLVNPFRLQVVRHTTDKEDVK